jgi:dTDP-4-dehydrorhamnose 3,5-epimerase
MMIRNEVPDVRIFTVPVHRDDRGYFQELDKTPPEVNPFVQTNCSWSQFGVLRGLHLQRKDPQGKRIHCLRGTIYDVWVDLRPGSKSFMKWGAFQLQAESGQSIYLPPGLAHGFFTMSKFALVMYQCTTLWDKESDGGVYWNDPEIGIEWPFDDGMYPILSDKDRQLPPISIYLKELESHDKDSGGL